MGIIVKSQSFRGVTEEAPRAYRDVTAVVDSTESAGLAGKVAKLVPLIVIKGSLHLFSERGQDSSPTVILWVCFLSLTGLGASITMYVAALRGVHMKKGIVFFILLALFLLFGGVGALAQEKSYITVKGMDLNNGVVIVDVVRDGKAYRLMCNEGMPGCLALKNGRYQMGELPKNFGMYECKDVEIYPEIAVNPRRTRSSANFTWRKNDWST